MGYNTVSVPPDAQRIGTLMREPSVGPAGAAIQRECPASTHRANPS
jgi:hypothetical protein